MSKSAKRGRVESPQKSDEYIDFKEKVEKGEITTISGLAKGFVVIANATNNECEAIKEAVEKNAKEIEENAEGLIDHEAKLADHDTRLEKVEKRIVVGEMRDVRKNLILRNVKYHPKADKEKETPQQTAEMIEKFFSELGIEKKVGPWMSKRYRGDGKNKAPTIIQLKLTDARDKALIYGALKGKKTKGISVSNEFPGCLKEQIKEAETKAKKIREDSGNKTRTRVEVEDYRVVIRVKKEGDSKYSNLV